MKELSEGVEEYSRMDRWGTGEMANQLISPQCSTLCYSCGT